MIEDAMFYPFLLFLYMTSDIILECAQSSDLLQTTSGMPHLGENGRSLRTRHCGSKRGRNNKQNEGVTIGRQAVGASGYSS
jgi:hypothetical protein